MRAQGPVRTAGETTRQQKGPSRKPPGQHRTPDPGKTTLLFKPRVCGESHSRPGWLARHLVRAASPLSVLEFSSSCTVTKKSFSYVHGLLKKTGRGVPFFKYYDFHPERTPKEKSFTQERKGASSESLSAVTRDRGNGYKNPSAFTVPLS